EDVIRDRDVTAVQTCALPIYMLSSKGNIYFPNLIHPGVGISKHKQFGKGNIISKGVALSTNITIGDFNLIHYNCSIGHDVSMGRSEERRVGNESSGRLRRYKE